MPHPTTGEDLWVLALADRKARPLVAGPGNEDEGQFSPDGRWVVYASDESGRWEIYVTSFPHGSGRWRVSTGGGRMPQWRRDGRELFYQDLSRNLMAVEVRGPSFEEGVPTKLFTLPGKSYAVDSGGQRFLTDEPAGSGEASPIVIVLNWAARFAADSAVAR